MTFHSIVEQWCSQYKPMLHNIQKGNRRFFLTDSTAGVVELAKQAPLTVSPFVLMESSVEGGGKVGLPIRNYPIYFFVRALKMADGDEAAVAKEEAWYHAQNFLVWLRQKHEEDSPMGDFGRINMEDYIDIQTVWPLENGWYAVLIQFERMEPLNLCVDEDMYVTCDDDIEVCD